ncbi:MAG: peptidase T [Lachnospiraceae bacterium]|nr:peptidase T [Lachnospiraceae bacterium]
MKAYERLLNYVKIDTPSDPASETTPSSECQFELAKLLVEELKGLGVENAEVDEKCYVYASIPATPGCEDYKRLGFIAHMDTAPDFNGCGVKPQIIHNYDGKDVVLGDSGRVLKVKDFPELAQMKDRTLITTDGTSLLGSDDKSGVAEIMTMVERILAENIPHGKICIGFTPDEEIGAGADHFDVEKFGADIAYTLDGGKEGEIEYENFNAAGAKVTVHGNNVHPGSAKDIMVNAQLVAMELNGMLPAEETPAMTEGYEGFFHLTDMSGNVEQAKLQYIIRDHSKEKFEERKALMSKNVALLNEKYGAGCVELELKDQYYNMKEMVEPHMHLIEYAKEAAREVGITPNVVPIRGGTDGARLSFMGLPCPNLGTGGFGFHGPYEHVTAEGMELCVEMMLKIVEKYSKS